MSSSAWSIKRRADCSLVVHICLISLINSSERTAVCRRFNSSSKSGIIPRSSSANIRLRIRLINGCVLGTIRGITTHLPVRLSRGMRPARTRDDFPLPDAPRTVINRRSFLLCKIGCKSLTNLSISFSREKKTPASSSVKCSRPG